MKYSVKLYGHLSDDKDRFSRELAVLLDIDAENALTLILNVPVVIVPGASKNEADRVARQLAAIRALYLIEPEGQEPEPEQPRKPLVDVLPEPSTAVQETETRRRGYMGLALLLGGLAVVLIVGSISFFSLFKRIRSEHQIPVSAPKVVEPGSRAGDQPSSDALQESIASLEERNEQLKSLIRLKQDDVAARTSSFQMDFDAVQRSRQELAELHEEMRSNLNEISRLKSALGRMGPPSATRFR
jgi:hypothetical protein